MSSESTKRGKLYLIPTFLDPDADSREVFPPVNAEIAGRLRKFIAEHEKQGRRFLKKLVPGIPQSELSFFELNKHTPPEEIRSFLAPLREGEDMGLLTDAGMPGIADPGAAVVRLAHDEGIETVPLVGPSSLFLALAASGLNGQHFTFHGYLPVDKKELRTRLKHMVAETRRTGLTHLFIETPYRNNRLLDILIATLPADFRLCMAAGLTGKSPQIRCMPVSRWQAEGFRPGKVPAVFLFGL
ncbi:MAG: SAM-dependent methyltransferase [Chlorobi bacterium]|nr:SAM-dependent methyltransferase [Chlorobiota bacterium]